MNKRITVTVFKPTGRTYYQTQWRDPRTGLKRTRSTAVSKKKAAQKVAGVLERQLNDGTYSDPSRTLWADVRDRYETEHLSTEYRESTWRKVQATFNYVEEILNPHMLVLVDTEAVRRLQRELTARGLAKSTIRSHLAHLKSALRWARRVPLADLKKLMRHASINTTMTFYASHDEDALAFRLWADDRRDQLKANTLANTGQKPSTAPVAQLDRAADF